MNESPSIQWFPGHMAKTRRLITESLPLVDIIVELCDARIPQSSRNPELDRLTEGKKRVILLNKCDASDPKYNQIWCDFYNKQGYDALCTDCKSGKGLNAFPALIRKALSEELARRQAKGMGGKPVRMMVLGIPNVGKSSFINRMTKSKKTKVEDRPGVTRGRQWVSTEDGFDFLDMPGILWPKFEDKVVGERLAFTGAIKDDILDIEHLAVRLLDVLVANYPVLLQERYKIENFEGLPSADVLALIGRKRGMLVSGGEVNTERAAITLVDEFRSGKIGRITLESPGNTVTDK